MACEVKLSELSTKFQNTHSIPSVGTTKLCFVSNPHQNLAMKYELLKKVQHGSMDVPIQTSQDLAGVIGIRKHPVIGISKMSDCIVIWKPVSCDNRPYVQPQRVILAFLHSLDLNSTTPDPKIPIAVWRIKYKNHSKVFELEPRVNDPSVIPVWKTMKFTQVLEVIRSMSTTTIVNGNPFTMQEFPAPDVKASAADAAYSDSEESTCSITRDHYLGFDENVPSDNSSQCSSDSNDNNNFEPSSDSESMSMTSSQSEISFDDHEGMETGFTSESEGECDTL
eukprot:3932346-Rhodomonas_salina.4